jgi:hypothetical protein
MKKIILILAVLILAVLMLAGCTSSPYIVGGQAPTEKKDDDLWVRRMHSGATPQMLVSTSVDGLDNRLTGFAHELDKYYTHLRYSIRMSDTGTRGLEPDTERRLNASVTVYLLSNESELDKLSSLFPRLKPYRSTRADFIKGTIAVMSGEPWEETRSKLMEAVAKLILKRFSGGGFPAWVEEGLIPINTACSYNNGQYYTTPVSAAFLNRLVRAIRENTLTPSRELVKKEDADFTDPDRLAAFGIIWWLLNSGRRNRSFFWSYIDLLQKGEAPPDFFEKNIRGDYEKLDESWRKWVLKRVQNRR